MIAYEMFKWMLLGAATGYILVLAIRAGCWGVRKAYRHILNKGSVK